MRIVLDLQCLQSSSKYRGIGRYALSVTNAILQLKTEHEFFIVLNNEMGEIQNIRTLFKNRIPSENILVFNASNDIKAIQSSNESKRNIAELMREAFIASLKPDLIHVFSLFEGYADDLVSSVHRLQKDILVSTTFYDLIPLLSPEEYLNCNPIFTKFYQEKLAYLEAADLLIAISDYAKKEAIENLALNPNNVVSAPLAVSDQFQPKQVDINRIQELQIQFNFNKKLIVYSGGSDTRKNLPRLVEAFRLLPREIQTHHQLMFVGQFGADHVIQLKELAITLGLEQESLLFSGYVTDQELVDIYNIAELYVFPSWHEGFGLPALEAMRCGTAVIGSNTSSLPEVIGLDDALFDPFSAQSIADKIQQVLTDKAFKQKLQNHGSQQAQKFSWSRCAQQTLQAWEDLYKTRASTVASQNQSILDQSKLLIDALRPYLKNEDKGFLGEIAQKIAQNRLNSPFRNLFVDISELHQRDSATGVQRVVRSYLMNLLKKPPKNFEVIPVYATEHEDYMCAYRFTNQFLERPHNDLIVDSPMQYKRGDVFFGLDMQHGVQIAKSSFYQKMRANGVTVKFLLHDLLPIQLENLFRDSSLKSLHETLLEVFSQCDGVISVSKATADAFAQWAEEKKLPLLPNFQNDWVHNAADLDGSKPSKGLPSGYIDVINKLKARPTFLMVSTIEPRKQQSLVFDAINQLWQQGIDVNLALVGKEGWKVEGFALALRNHPENGQRLFWLEGISDEYLDLVYQSSSVLVAASLNEGFGLSLIEAARHHLPIIARDISVFREVAGNNAFYFNADDDQSLAPYLKQWLEQYTENKHLRSDGLQWNTWEQSTEQLKHKLVFEHCASHQLLIDVSELVKSDAKSGIQRVVRSVLFEWLINPPLNYKIEPVYASTDEGYRYAREFTQRFLGNQVDTIVYIDEVADYSPGDIFIGLDLQPIVVQSQQETYQKMRNQGVKVNFVLYDLLPVLQSEYFPGGANIGFENWLKVIAQSDGIFAISKAVSDEFTGWANAQNINLGQLKNNWFHLGADIDNSVPSKGLDDESYSVIEQLSSANTFLMVGTLEPRKGYLQVLESFNILWQNNVNVILVIVGKRGWLCDDLINKIKQHPELNKRLFWLKGISDEFLEQVYTASTCLIAASYGEGFGLPLIEAAQKKKPIIARDIPVFREVAGDHAYYFADKKDPQVISQAVTDWLYLYKNSQHPKSDNMPWMMWKQSANQLLNRLKDNQIC